MLFEFSGENLLGLHLGMTGKMRIEKPTFRAEKHDHLVLQQADRSLVFRDSRQFGRVRFHHGKDQPEWWRAHIPEISERGFDQKFLDDFLRRHRKAPIKAVLLMQSGFSGIGNWMADEILWRAKIHPALHAAKLTKKNRAAVLKETKFVARESLRLLGRDFSDPPKSWLIHQRWKAGWRLPEAQNQTAPRDDWRTNDRMVSEMPIPVGCDGASRRTLRNAKRNPVKSGNARFKRSLFVVLL